MIVFSTSLLTSPLLIEGSWGNNNLSVTINPGESILLDDSWYWLPSLQSAINDGYVTVDGYNATVITPSSVTPKLQLTKAAILATPNFPVDAITEYNSNFDILDASKGSVWGGITGKINDQTDLLAKLNTKASISGQVFTGNIVAQNLSGINTGNETQATIKTKLGAANASADGYLTAADWNAFNSGSGSFVPTYRTVNGHELSSNVSVTKSDVDLGNVANVDTTTTANITDYTNKRFVTDVELAAVANVSGVNTGDETQATIKSKLGVANGSADGYLASGDWTIFNNKLSSEADTLTTVTGRGATTNTESTFSNGLVLPKIRPAADSTTAIQVNNSAGTLTIVNIDTTNARLGIGTIAPAEKLSVLGNVSAAGDFICTLSGTVTQASGLITQITKSGGRTLTFTYNADNTINTVVDGTRTWTYAYSGGILTGWTVT